MPMPLMEIGTMPALYRRLRGDVKGSKNGRLYELDEPVPHGPEADLTAVAELDGPVAVIAGPEDVLARAPGDDQIGRGFVDGNGVGGRQDADIVHDGALGPGHAVTILGDLDEKVDETHLAFEMGLDGQGVLGQLLLEALGVLVPAHLDRPDLTDHQTFAAADAFLVVDEDVSLGLDDGVLGTVIDANAAVAALFRVDTGMDDGVLVEFSGPRCASHSHVLNSGGDAGLDMACDMGQAEEGLRVQEGAPDPGGLDPDVTPLRVLGVAADESVGDNDRDIDDVRSEAVAPGKPDMVDGIRTMADIERVRVC